MPPLLMGCLNTTCLCEERIESFVRMHPLLKANFEVLKASAVESKICQKCIHQRYADPDLARLKSLYMNTIRCDWAIATRINPRSLLGTTRGQVHWKKLKVVKMQTGPKTATTAFVARHEGNLTHTFHSLSPSLRWCCGL
eukprot:2957374-Pleurochrysis_carterae.AAC.2